MTITKSKRILLVSDVHTATESTTTKQVIIQVTQSSITNHIALNKKDTEALIKDLQSKLKNF